MKKQLKGGEKFLDKCSNVAWKAKIEYRIGVSCFMKGDLVKSFELIQDAFGLFEMLDNKNGLMQAYNMLGILIDLQGNYSMAFDFYSMSLQLAQELGDQMAMARVWIST